MSEYGKVKEVVAELGLRASKEKIREKLGGGSYQDLWPLITRARQELSAAPVAYSWPEPDPQRVQALLSERRGERAVEDMLVYAEAALASLELMSQEIPKATAWALTRHWALSMYMPHHEIRNDLMGALRVFLKEAGQRFDEIRATRQEGGDHGTDKPAA
jgi:hypothetical protein